MNTTVVVAAGSVVITAVAIPGCIVIARRFGVIDRPGPLKPHEAPVPYLGGVAVFAGLVVGVLAGKPIALIPLAAATALGVMDDRFGLPAPWRLVAELGVGVAVAGTVPMHVAGWMGIPLVVLATVVLINGFNLLDGLDMLAAGVGAAAAVGFAVITHGPARLMAASLAGALVAFLWSNRPPARIYLGDGGSYLLGAAMSVLLAFSWGVGVAVPTGVIALALLVLPVAEVACAIVRRRRAKRSLFAGDRAHPYDLLVARGWTRLAASGSYIALEVMIVVVVSIAVGAGVASVPVAVAIDASVAVVVLGGAALVGGFRDPAGSVA